ncbi:MAG: hypothetical protein HOY71_05245 [Nonomuraea sp.]|nr:hypothetical protein [Nonomuraea sp.]
MAEPRIVVANREHLWRLLTEASQLEHMIACQYLFAEFSLKDDPRSAGWRKTLHDIAVEEMLHLALVANLMAAIGAAPTFGRPNFPRVSGYFPDGFRMELRPFGEQAIARFLQLELPEGMAEPGATGRDSLDPAELMPRGQDYATIGHLYRGIEEGLKDLCDTIGERAVFIGVPRAQATPELFRWPQLVAVTDLKSALSALDTIIEQGEGSRGDWRTAHYGRFLRMSREYEDLRARDPGFEPAHPVLPAYLRQPFDQDEPQPLITDPAARRVAELATVAYELVLHTLTRFWTHTTETEEQLGHLAGLAIGLMAAAVRPLAATLATLPAGPEHPGRTAGFTFEMYYAMSNFVPWQEPSWALLHERLAVLAQGCERTPEAPPQVTAAVSAFADQLRRAS